MICLVYIWIAVFFKVPVCTHALHVGIRATLFVATPAVWCAGRRRACRAVAVE